MRIVVGFWLLLEVVDVVIVSLLFVVMILSMVLCMYGLFVIVVFCVMICLGLVISWLGMKVCVEIDGIWGFFLIWVIGRVI